jgi:hypothetical protein
MAQLELDRALAADDGSSWTLPRSWPSSKLIPRRQSREGGSSR